MSPRFWLLARTQVREASATGPASHLRLWLTTPMAFQVVGCRGHVCPGEHKRHRRPIRLFRRRIRHPQRRRRCRGVWCATHGPPCSAIVASRGIGLHISIALAVCFLALGTAGLPELRRSLIGRATGDVLEIGIGTGINLPLYRFSPSGAATLTGKSAQNATSSIGESHLMRPCSSAAGSEPRPSCPAGLDTSSGMLGEARQRAAALRLCDSASGAPRVRFVQGDVTRVRMPACATPNRRSITSHKHH